MKPTILLFDVDGTLITTDGVGRRAIELAFDRAHGQPEACTSFPFDGMTDYAIVRRGLSAIGVEVTPASMQRVLQLYLEALDEQVRGASLARYRVHPGMREAISAASAWGFAIGLGTGNLKEGARIKLEKVDLYRHFQFGGFGCDDEHRTELIRIGAERGAVLLGRAMDACRLVVIGDTPKDVVAAQGVGAQCIGVGTGSYSVDELLAAGAVAAFEDLTAPGALDALLGS